MRIYYIVNRLKAEYYVKANDIVKAINIYRSKCEEKDIIEIKEITSYIMQE